MWTYHSSILAGGGRGLMRPEEVAYLAYRLGEQVLWFPPGKDGHFRLWRQRRDIHGDLVRVRRRVVRHHQHRCVARPYEVARHAVHEVGPDAIEAVQVCFDRRHGQIGPSREKLGCPVVAAGVVHDVRVLRPVSNGLAEHASDDAVGGPLHELEGKWATDAVAHEEELPDAEVVHEPELVIREGAPGVVDGDRSAGLTTVGVSLIHRDAAEVVFEFLHGVEHRRGPITNAGVQAPTGGDQEREARAGLLVADADVALFVKWHSKLSC